MGELDHPSGYFQEFLNYLDLLYVLRKLMIRVKGQTAGGHQDSITLKAVL